MDDNNNTPPLSPPPQEINVAAHGAGQKRNTGGFKVGNQEGKKAKLKETIDPQHTSYHPMKQKKWTSLLNTKKSFNSNQREEWNNAFHAFLNHMKEQPTCNNKKICTCMNVILNNSNLLPKLHQEVSQFFLLDKSARNLCLKLKIQYAKRRVMEKSRKKRNEKEGREYYAGKIFEVCPFCPPLICKDAFQKLYNVSIEKFKQLKEEINSGDIYNQKEHGLVGKEGNSKNREVHASIDDFFKRIKEIDGEEITSKRVKRVIKGTSQYQEVEEEILRLPPGCTKAMVFRRWAYENGYIVDVRDVDKFSNRLDDDWVKDGDREAGPRCSYTNFLIIWKNQHKNVKIANRR